MARVTWQGRASSGMPTWRTRHTGITAADRHVPTIAQSTILASLLLLGLAAWTEGASAQPTSTRFASTRLCPLVPARDAAEAGFPPAPPVRPFGTDLGFSYEKDERIVVLFGDTWQRIDICPIQLNDDSLATLAIPADDWPGYTARASLPAAQCPALEFEVDDAGTAFAPIVLHRWDGEPIPLGPLNTPLAGFYDGEHEWGIFIVAGGRACEEGGASGSDDCADDGSGGGSGLACGLVSGKPLCLEPFGTRRGDTRQAFELHFAERVGPTDYVSRASFLTNKFLNLAARAVRSFDPAHPTDRDDRVGTGALLLWGRPGFNERPGDGEASPYFMVHELPFERDGERIVFQPRFLSSLEDGQPAFSPSQADAVPLYRGELEPVNQTAFSWIAPISRWLMIYGGMSIDLTNVDGSAGRTQPVPGAMYARTARDPWGPWSDPVPVLTEAQMAGDMVCGKRAPEGCLAPPDPPIRPVCIERVDAHGGGALYGAAILDAMTRPASGANGAPAADVFWLVSTWHPYGVVLARTRVEVAAP